MQVHQILVSARMGEAQMQAALELRDLLRRLGPSEIYARYIHADAADEVLSITKLGRRWSANPRADLLLYHSSIGDPEVHRLVMDRPERLVMMYHNISPAEAFARYDPALAGLLERGREELVDLRDRVEVALADSPYNARELIALGYRDVRVSPLVIDVPALRAVEAHEPTMNHLTHGIDGPILLFVGQMLPHKRPDFLLQAYHLLVTYIRPDAHLVMVGGGSLTRYRVALERYVRELNLNRCWMTGPVSQAELVAFYRGASAFVTASEHEGFCVPLVEAMGFDLPVAARGFAAIPETLAGAGIVVPPDAGPDVMAEAMAVVLDESPVRDELVARGRRRLADYDADGARAAVLDHLLDIV